MELDVLVAQIKKASEDPYPDLINREQALLLQESLQFQVTFLKARGLEDVKKLKPHMQEAEYFLTELVSLLVAETYQVALEELWNKLKCRHSSHWKKWDHCARHETVKRYVYYSKLESLSQFIQMLVRRPT